jgi:hypothetical protein
LYSRVQSHLVCYSTVKKNFSQTKENKTAMHTEQAYRQNSEINRAIRTNEGGGG